MSADIDIDTFVYDATCSLCTSSVEWLRERSDDSVVFRAADDAVLAALDAKDDFESGALLVTAAGDRFVGAQAFGEVLRRSPKYDRNLLGRLILEQPSRTIATWVYSWVAKNRYRLSGGTGAGGRAA